MRANLHLDVKDISKMTLTVPPITTQMVLAATTAGAVAILASYWYQKKIKNAIPTKWEPVGKVKSLFIYPLKSGRRMEITTVHCAEYGFEIDMKSSPYLRDRCLVVYKGSDKEFRTARTYPKLLLISLHADDECHFTLTAPGMEPIRVKVPTEKSKADKITLWQQVQVFSMDCGDEVAQWLSRYILGNSSGLRLAYHDGIHRADIRTTHKAVINAHPKLGNAAIGMYSDLTSYMLMSESSVNDLIRRAPDANITMNNFRPSIVVDGKDLVPYAEDNWDWIKIGPVVLRNVKDCTRCSLTTFDPETALRSPDEEPLKTLKQYRKIRELKQIEIEGDSPVLGIHLGLLSHGADISVGDTVYIGKN